LTLTSYSYCTSLHFYLFYIVTCNQNNYIDYALENRTEKMIVQIQRRKKDRLIRKFNKILIKIIHSIIHISIQQGKYMRLIFVILF